MVVNRTLSETKIDRIESRLASIEQLLRQSSATLSSAVTESVYDSPHEISHHEVNSTKPLGASGDHATQVSAAGDVGVQAESIAAKQTLEQTVDQDPILQQDPQLRNALSSLRRIVDCVQSDVDESTTVKPLSKDVSQARLPDWEEVRLILERVEGDKAAIGGWLWPALLDDFCRKCRAMYEQDQKTTPTDKILVYSVMSNICCQFSGTDGAKAADSSQELSRTCSCLLLQALDTFPMLSPSSLTTAEALMVAASTTIGMCKPSLSWSLSCAAAQMCRALGYNRLQHNNSRPDPLLCRKALLFWSVYTLDRNTSLRLGRSPALQDYDIRTPMLTPDDDAPPATVNMIRFWVECGRVQGKISTQLYGPEASSLDPDKRARLAESLADELEEIHQRKTKAMSDIIPHFNRRRDEMNVDFMVHGDDVMHYSNLTLALYAIPTNHPNRFRALEAARKCLSLSRDVSRNHLHNVHAWKVYCHWVLLHTPLTPFTGIFCNIIVNPQESQQDINLLEDFVSSIQPARRLSEGIEKYYQLCAIFVQVAQAYVRAKTAQQDLGNKSGIDVFKTNNLQPIIGEFDHHLSTLGFNGPEAGLNMHEPYGDDAALKSFADTDPDFYLFGMTNLLDRYPNDLSIQELLEQDLVQLDNASFGLFGNESQGT
ncbi:hypothetical protein FSARC_6413 [Fusarium sarcochroum]|uniref:Xylanolytic transcriptional activator regulatory domain-containing protein n=1 Tax=Fusarium sarcochroum TaxID=1208366 RepID=A0A8H4TX76_9HYPO|nr:hypothetical protein FSARC_6413 [Fusarium sarcochroum]